MEDGTPYRGKHTFTCRAQVDGFKRLFEQIAAQDYVSDHGMTTNTVEEFDVDETDPGHICKTNMSICHKVHTYTYVRADYIVTYTVFW